MAVLVSFFEPALSNVEWLQLAPQPTWKYLILGVVLVHFKTIVNLVRRPPRFDESVEKAFAVIREAEKKGVPKNRIRDMYLDLCRGVLSNVKIKQATQREMRELLDAPSSLIPPSSGPGADRDDKSGASIPDSPDTTWETEAKNHLKQGRKINAIKVVRDHTGMSLAAAKALVESWTISSRSSNH